MLCLYHVQFLLMFIQLKWPEACRKWRWGCGYDCSWLSDVRVCRENCIQSLKYSRSKSLNSCSNSNVILWNLNIHLLNNVISFPHQEGNQSVKAAFNGKGLSWELMIPLIFVILENRHRLRDSHLIMPFQHLASSLEISMYACILIFITFFQTIHILAAYAPHHVESTPN